MSRWVYLAGAGLTAAVVITTAAAADVVSVNATLTETATGADLSLQPGAGELAAPKASIAGGVLTVTFAQPVTIDVQSLTKSAERLAASARLSTDGKSLRVALRRSMTPSIAPSGAGYVIALAPGAAQPADVRAAVQDGPRALNAGLSVGVHKDYTRLTFSFSGPTRPVLSQTDETVSLRFNRAAEMDLAPVRVSPPRFLTALERTSREGAPFQLKLQVAPGVKARSFSEENRVIVDLLKPADAPKAETPPASPPPTAQDVMPLSGRVVLRVDDGPTKTSIVMLGTGKAAAAAFRRNDSIWIVLDGQVDLDLAGARRGGRRFGAIEVVTGAGVTALRLQTTAEMQVSGRVADGAWAFDLAPRFVRTEAAAIRRDVSIAGRGNLIADFNRAGVVRRLRDPADGAEFLAALALGPSIGIESQRGILEAAIAPAAHGALIETMTDEVEAAFVDGDLIVSRTGGLLATGETDAVTALTNDKGNPSATVAQDFTAIRETLDELERRVAGEGFEPGARVAARMALARFYLDQDFAPEALGALRLALIHQPQLELDPAFRLMRGTANAMLGRVREARADLDMAALEQDPTAALWRGYIAANQRDWARAARELSEGRGALLSLPDVWQGRLKLAIGEAAFALDNLAAASAAASESLAAADPETALRARVLQARLAAARGDGKAALAVLDEVANAPYEAPAVLAVFHATWLRKASGEITPLQAAEILEALRFRWRGDAIEIETLQELGVIYAEAKKWREGFTVMRQGALRFVDLPMARDMRVTMGELFARLFLKGEADELEPIQALGLFYDFSDLTPIGPDGDRMVRTMAGRLAKLDLLEQAAQLLQHQVQERLEGIGRAQIAADLAGIYLSDKKPEKALAALELTRQPNMPAEMLSQRRVLEAKALLDLGRIDHALEILERDRSEPAQRVRAEAAWRDRDWPRAAAELRQVLAMRPKNAALEDADRAAILRAAIAMTFADDTKGLAALRSAWLAPMSTTADAESFDVVSAGIDADGAEARELARAISRTDLLDRFVERMRKSMPGATAAAQQPAAPAAG